MGYVRPDSVPVVGDVCHMLTAHDYVFEFPLNL